MEDISQLRQKLALLVDQKKALTQRLSAKKEAWEKYVKELKNFDQDYQFAQRLLHSYAGASVALRKDAIGISFTPICCGIPQSQYKMILYNMQTKSWQVAGYNLPVSVFREQGTKIFSEEELCKFVQDVAREVEAYAERKYQVLETEKILEKAGFQIWYCTKFQKVILNLPIPIPGSEEKVKSQVILDYEVDHILPIEVDTKASDLNAKHLEKLRERLRKFFLHFSLLAVIKEEFGSDEEGEVSYSTERSILQSLASESPP